MTEADEIAINIIAIAHNMTFDQARLLATRYMGTPAEVGYQLHANISESIFNLKGTPDVIDR